MKHSPEKVEAFRKQSQPLKDRLNNQSQIYKLVIECSVGQQGMPQGHLPPSQH